MNKNRIFPSTHFDRFKGDIFNIVQRNPTFSWLLPQRLSSTTEHERVILWDGGYMEGRNEGAVKGWEII